MVNLLFIQMNPEMLKGTLPFIVAFDLDGPELNKPQWRVDAKGVKHGIGEAPKGMHGVWRYLAEGTWEQVTQEQAYAKFPDLKHAIEKGVVPW